MLKHQKQPISVTDLNSYILANNLSWLEINQFVKIIQKEIYEHSCKGNSLQIRYKQEILINSKEACFFAMRCVLNRHLQHELKVRKQKKDFLFVDGNYFFGKTYLNQLISKNDEMLINLTTQELLLIILRPEWEARVESNSYGFSSNIAITQTIIKTYSILSKDSNYESSVVLVGKLDESLQKFHAPSVLRKSNYEHNLTTYLKLVCKPSFFLSSLSLAGKKFQSNDVLSLRKDSFALLIANILFYGLETAIAWKFEALNNDRECARPNKVKTIICSDHFLVVFSLNNIRDISLAINLLRSFFSSLDLNLQNNSLSVRSVHEGFDFLGFNFKRYNNKSTWNDQTTKLIVKPTRDNIKKHFLSMRHCLYHKDRLNRWRANAQMTQYDVINQLNPLIKDFSQYYRDLTPPFILRTLDRTLNEIIYRYAIKKYKSNRSKKWNENWTTIVQGKKIIAYQNKMDSGYKALCLHERGDFS
nr:hypothetical protein [Porphyrostromium japonicum]